MPRSNVVPDFVPRAIEAQFLSPWNRKTRLRFAPEPKLKPNARPRKQSQRKDVSILSELADL